MHEVLEVLAVAIAVVPLAWYYSMSARMRYLHLALMLLLSVPVATMIARAVGRNITHPPLWDFTCFWVYGRATAQGHNAYSPAVLWNTAHALGIQSTPSFAAEVLNLGAVYPPPSLLIFAPLGVLTNIHAASALWMILQIAGLIGLAVSLWFAAFRAYGFNGAAASLLLSCAFPATLINLSLGQTLIVATLFAMLFVFDPNYTRRGLWLGLGAAVKPLLFIPVLYMVIRRKLAAITSFLGTIVFMTAAVAVLTGVGTIILFVHANPASHEPPYLFHELQYQSIAAVLLRLSENGVLHGMSVNTGAFAASAILTAVTIAICVTCARDDTYLCAGGFIALSLLVYPATANFYGELLVVPLMALWLWCTRRGIHLVWPALLFVAEAVLLSQGESQYLGFLAFSLTWLALILVMATGRFTIWNRGWLRLHEGHMFDGH